MAAAKKTGPRVMRTNWEPPRCQYKLVTEWIFLSLEDRFHLTNLHDEPGLPPRILPVQDASYVAEDLVETTKQHRRHEPPGLVSPAEDHLDSHADGVKRDQGAAGRERWSVAVHAGLDRADGNRAVGIVAAGRVDQAIGARENGDIVVGHFF